MSKVKIGEFIRLPSSVGHQSVLSALCFSSSFSGASPYPRGQGRDRDRGGRIHPKECTILA